MEKINYFQQEVIQSVTQKIERIPQWNSMPLGIFTAYVHTNLGALLVFSPTYLGTDDKSQRKLLYHLFQNYVALEI